MFVFKLQSNTPTITQNRLDLSDSVAHESVRTTDEIVIHLYITRTFCFSTVEGWFLKQYVLFNTRRIFKGDVSYTSKEPVPQTAKHLLLANGVRFSLYLYPSTRYSYYSTVVLARSRLWPNTSTIRRDSEY